MLDDIVEHWAFILEHLEATGRVFSFVIEDLSYIPFDRETLLEFCVTFIASVLFLFVLNEFLKRFSFSLLLNVFRLYF